MPRNYKHSNVSISPMIQLTREGERALKQVEKLDERRIEGMKLVVLEAATLFMRVLKRTAPKIDGVKYTDDLKPVFMVDQSGEVTFSIIAEGRERESAVSDNEIAYLYPKGTLDPLTQKWYEVLRRYQPFPVTMYPMTTGREALVGLSVRRVSKGALADAERRIMGKKGEIERLMSGVGVPITISKSDDSKSVQTDLAFAIMQVEYGLGRRADSHWRPAIEMLKGEIGVLQDKFKKFISTGNKAIFDVDSEIEEVSNIKEARGDLQKRLAQSTGLTVEKL